MISFLVDVWQVQAIGAIYLMFIAGNHLFKTYVKKNTDEETEEKEAKKNKRTFGGLYLKLKLQISPAVDSILAAVALAMTLPKQV